MGIRNMHDVNVWWMAAGWVLMALIWIGIAVLAILAFKWFLRHNEATTKQSPMDIARELNIPTENRQCDRRKPTPPP